MLFYGPSINSLYKVSIPCEVSNEIKIAITFYRIPSIGRILMDPPLKCQTRNLFLR